MERLLKNIQEAVILEGGGEGITLGRLWEIFESRGEQIFEIKSLNKSLLWSQLKDDDTLIPKEELPKDFPKFINFKLMVPDDIRRLFYCRGRLLKLNDIQMTTLDIIAKTGRNGLTQSDAAKQLKIDPRNFFHQLKALLDYKLISRIPVSQQKSFTYLLFITGYSPNETETLGQAIDDDTGRSPSGPTPTMVGVRSRIMETLQAAPHKTMAATELYKLLGYEHVRIYQRNISWLIQQGFVESFVAEELGGVTGRILKWKKPLVNQVRKLPTQKNIEPESKESTNKLSLIHRGTSLESQIYQFIDASGPKGVTLSDIMVGFGLNRKFSYRIGERLSGGKVFLDSDVIKLAEFSGKERRHRFFTKSGQSRFVDKDSSTNKGIVGKDIIEILSESAGGAPRNSVTRVKRLNALMEIVNESNVTESGKPLASELQRRLNETDFLMDSKTLKRMISILEAEGKLKTLIIVLPNNTNRTILLRNDLSVDDTIVAEYVEKIKRSRSELSFPSTPPAVIVDDIDGDEKEDKVDVSISSKSHKFKMQKHGYVYGILQRCRLLHLYLLNSFVLPRGNFDFGDNWLCETIPCFFRQIPFELFLQIVGIGEMSPELSDFINDPKSMNLTLEQLPISIKTEIHRRRVDRHKTVVKLLMELLSELGLANPDNRYPSVAFKLPYQYRLTRFAPIMDLTNGIPIDTIDLSTPNSMENYWDWLYNLMNDENQVVLPNSFPSAFKLAQKRDSWQLVSPFSRAFRKQIRNLLVKKYNLTGEEFEEEVDKLVIDHEIEKEVVLRELKNLEELTYRERARRSEERRAKRLVQVQNKRARILPSPSTPGEDSLSEDDVIDENLNEEHVDRTRKMVLQTFSKQELELLRIAFLILHNDIFKSPNGLLQWVLIDELYKSGAIPLRGKRSTEELRTMFQRFLISYEQLQKIRLLENRISLIDRSIRAGYIDNVSERSDDEDLEGYFVRIFIFYKTHLDNFSSLLKEIHRNQLVTCDVDHSKMLLIDEGEKLYDPSNYWKKMTRSQQIRFFNNVPSLIFASSELSRHQAEKCKEAIDAIKKVLAIPTSKYDAAQAKHYLQRFDPETINSAVDELLLSGLLIKGESPRFQLRIPGGEFSVNEKFVQIINGDDWLSSKADNEIKEYELQVHDQVDVTLMVKSVIQGIGNLEFEMVRGVPRVAYSSKSAPFVEFEKLVPLNDKSNIWYNISGELDTRVLRSACKFIYEQIRLNPGITRNEVKSSCYPYLSNVEVDKCLDCLNQAQLVTHELNIECYFPSY